MSPKEVATHLKTVRSRLANMEKAVRKKRSWRPSEQAMTLVAIAREIEAVDLAIQQFERSIT